MEYIAHIEEERKQRLIDHLDGTAKLAGKFAESFGKYEWGYCIGMLHDLGKYSKEFQHKIQFNTNDRVDHSTAGMRLCNEKGGYYSILQYAIAGHHSGLMDYYKLEERYRTYQSGSLDRPEQDRFHFAKSAEQRIKIYTKRRKCHHRNRP